jgi:hypothetical protein
MIKSLCTTILLIICSLEVKAQVVKIQFINNSADDSLSLIDFYVNGNPAISSLAYHEASIFFQTNLTLQAIEIGVAKAGVPINDTFYSLSTTLPISSTNEYIIVANGIKSPTGYTPKKPFSLSVFPNAVENVQFNTTSIIFMHGSTDAAPQLDLRSGITDFGDIGYSQFTSNYATFPSNDFALRMTNSSGSKTIQNYLVPIGSLPSYSGKATLILSSGFVTPANNKNGDPFGLWMVPPGGGFLIPLSTTVPEALSRLQFIHNSADTSIDSVDVYINGVKTADDLPFRNATRFEDLFAKVPVDIVISKQTSTVVTDDTLAYTTIVFDSAKAYTIVMNGLDTPTTAYTPIVPLSLTSYNNVREFATNSNSTDVLIMNGATDVPALNVSVNSTQLASSLAYKTFAPSYYSTPTADIVLDVSGSSPINKYSANFQTLGLQGEAVTILSSGFTDALHNRHGPAFGMYMTMPNGGPLIKLPINTGITGITSNKAALSIWPNPAGNTLYLNGDITFNKAEVTVYDLTGKIAFHSNSIANKQINISGLAKGSYIIKITDGVKSVSQQFIKN